MPKDWKNDVASGADNDARNAEAYKILFEMGLKDAALGVKHNERDFVTQLVARFEQFQGKTIVSSKQLFWLRDLKEKYL